MERCRVSDLLAPASEQEVNDREKQSEKHGVGEIEREWQGIGGFCVVANVVDHFEVLRVLFHGLDGFGFGRRRRLPANVHWDGDVLFGGNAGGESDGRESEEGRETKKLITLDSITRRFRLSGFCLILWWSESLACGRYL